MFKNLHIFVVAVVLTFFGIINGQQAKSPIQSPSSLTFDQSYPGIKVKAKATADALVRGDYNMVADNTYHRVVKLMGGRANTVFVIGEEMRKVEQKGYSVKSVRVGEPEKAQIIGKQIFSVVPMAMTMKTPSGTLLAESFLLAISDDGSKTWTFVDGALAVNRQALRQILPFAAYKLRLPPKKQPVFYPN